MLPQDERSEPIAEMERMVEELKQKIQQIVNERDGQDAVEEEKQDRTKAVDFIKENARSAIRSSAYAARHSIRNSSVTKGKTALVKEKAVALGRAALRNIHASINEEQREKFHVAKETAVQKLQILHKKGCLLLDDVISSPAFSELQAKVQMGIKNGLSRLHSLKDKED